MEIKRFFAVENGEGITTVNSEAIGNLDYLLLG
jgi:hypothetical protein